MNKEKIISCGDCGVFEGQIHKEGCDQEVCPKCNGQLLSCGCSIKGEGREPFFWKGFQCARCGKNMPNLFMVSDEDWKNICGHTYELSDVLCLDCMKSIFNKRGLGKLKLRDGKIC